MRDIRVHRIAGFGLTSGNATRLMEFYAKAFGARHVSSEYLTGARFERQMGVGGGALRHTLELGREAVDILQFDTPGAPYPRPLSPDHPAFQHFALVVSNMDLALALAQGAGLDTDLERPAMLASELGGRECFQVSRS